MLKKFYLGSIAVLLLPLILSAQSEHLSSAAFTHQQSSSTHEKLTQFDKVKWKFDTKGKIFSSPTLFNGMVYIGSEDHNLYAIDLKTGKARWKFKTGGAVHSTPALFNQAVYFGSFDGYYYAVDAATGKEKWRIQTGGEKWMGGIGYFGFKPVDQYHDDPWDFFLSSVVPDPSDQGRTLYFGSSDGELYAVDAASGSIRWRFQAGNSIHTTPAVQDQTVYVGSWDATLYAIDTRTGKLKWKFVTGDKPAMTGIQSSPVVADGKIYFGARDAHLYCLDAYTGKEIWKYDAEGSWILGSPTIKDGIVYAGTSDSYLLLGLDASTGQEKFRFKTHGYIYSSPTIVGNTAYFGDFTGAIFAVDLSTGKCSDEFALESRTMYSAAILKENQMDFTHAAGTLDPSLYSTAQTVMNKFYSLGPVVSSATLSEGILYVGSANGSLYAIQMKEGKCPE